MTKTIKDVGFNKYLSRDLYGVGGDRRYKSIRDISGGELSTDTIIELGKGTVIDGKRRRILIRDGTVDRTIIGLREDGTYGMDISKPSTSVIGAGLGDLVSSDRMIRTAYKFSTFTISPSEIITDNTGFINFRDDAGDGSWNRVVRLDFYKDSTFTIETATLESKYFSGIAIGGALAENTDVNTFLNPTKTKTTGADGSDYFKYTVGSGQTIRALYDPSGDEVDETDDFDSTEIAAIGDGWNELVMQTETDSTATFGFGTMNLLLVGYVTL